MALKNIGALWRKEKQGKKFFSGTIELIAGQKIKILAMPYQLKAGDKPNPKAPAYTILLSTEQKDKQSPTAQDED